MPATWATPKRYWRPGSASAAPPGSALVQQATILQYRHEFAAARTTLQRALKAAPEIRKRGCCWPRSTCCKVDLRSAANDRPQVARTGGIAVGLACTANLRSNTGQAEQSLGLLAQIDVDTAKMPASFRAWVQGLQAESAERLGQWNKAEGHYQRALALTPDDNFLLVGVRRFPARSRTAQGSPRAAQRFCGVGHDIFPPGACPRRAAQPGG